MYGAIIGDIVGSIYEFDNIRTKEFPLFSHNCYFTDDTVMSVAVAAALMYGDTSDLEFFKQGLIALMHQIGNQYARCGYGDKFGIWITAKMKDPYNSYGNGSAMRVSPVIWCANSLQQAEQLAKATAEVTHNHPEGIKGAQATAAAIFLARKGIKKEKIKEYIEMVFGYDLSRSCDEIRPFYRHVESCMETVPEAITAFLEGNSFEDVIRTAVSLGGDADTLTAIAGSIAEGFYGVPDRLKKECHKRLNKELDGVLCVVEKVVAGS